MTGVVKVPTTIGIMAKTPAATGMAKIPAAGVAKAPAAAGVAKTPVATAGVAKAPAATGVAKIPAAGVAKTPAAAGVAKTPVATTGVAKAPAATGVAKTPGMAKTPAATGMAKTSAATGVAKALAATGSTKTLTAIGATSQDALQGVTTGQVLAKGVGVKLGIPSLPASRRLFAKRHPASRLHRPGQQLQMRHQLRGGCSLKTLLSGAMRLTTMKAEGGCGCPQNKMRGTANGTEPGGRGTEPGYSKGCKPQRRPCLGEITFFQAVIDDG